MIGQPKSVIISNNGQPTKTEIIPSYCIIKQIIIQHKDIQPVQNHFAINFPHRLPLVAAQVRCSIA